VPWGAQADPAVAGRQGGAGVAAVHADAALDLEDHRHAAAQVFGAAEADAEALSLTTLREWPLDADVLEGGVEAAIDHHVGGVGRQAGQGGEGGKAARLRC
jgi:hypothetical protein